MNWMYSWVYVLGMNSVSNGEFENYGKVSFLPKKYFAPMELPYIFISPSYRYVAPKELS
jgi:hypothetical protein